MAAGRPILGLLALFFVAGALLLMFLTFLGGVRNSNPVNDIYFLQADTSAIPGAPSTSRWTFWNLCAVSADGKSDCGANYPDFPFDPPSPRNFNTTINVPSAFVGTNHYFLMSRFMFPFMLIALFFGVMSLFIGLLALCTRIGSYLSSVLVCIAWVFQVITTCLMTACYVQARDHFNNNKQSSGLGKKAFGFMWAAVACLTISTVLFFMGGTAGRDSSSGYSGQETRRRGFFASRRSSTRSRGSFGSKHEDAV